MGWQSIVIAYVGLSFAPVAIAQVGSQQSEAQLRARALERCKANRGVDCDDPKALRQWVSEERPMTAEQQQRAVAARRARERQGR